MATKISSSKLKEAKTKASKEFDEMTATNYLKVGSKFYSIKEVDRPIKSIADEIKEFYKRRYDDLARTLTDPIVEDCTNEWNTQIDHLQTKRSKKSITVNQEDFNTPLYYHSSLGRFLRLKPAWYAPDTILTDYGYLERALPSGCVTLRSFILDTFNTDVNTVAQFEIVVKPPVAIPVMIGLDSNADKLYMFGVRATPHRFSGGRVCTGNHTAQDYFNLPSLELSRQLSRINLFSTMSNWVTNDTGSINYTISNLLLPVEKIININIRQAGEEQWTTQR